MRIIVQPAAGNEAIEIGGEAVELQASDEGGEIIGMGADIAGRAADAGLRRIGAPGSLFLAVCSTASVSQSCGYSAWTTRMSPSSPFAIISRAWRTIG